MTTRPLLAPIYLSLAAIVSFAAPAQSAVLFSDGFESGDRSATGNGFSWGRAGDNVFVSDSVARSGNHSLCFTYAGKPAGSDSTAEQRFSLGRAHTELWIRFHLRFPANYRHRSDSPSNNKLVMLWSREYTDYGNQAGMHLWSDGAGNSRLSYTVGPNSPHFPNRNQGGLPTFVTVPDDLGKWIEITYHWKRQTTANSADGVVEIWRKVGNSQRQKIVSHTNLSNTWGTGSGSNPADNFLDKGYLMGWANSGFDDDTTVCLDDITFSTTAIDEGQVPRPPTGIVAD